jgi:hypothetical protein
VATHFFKAAFLKLALDSDNFDGADFDKNTPHYQMVPVDASRTLQLQISPVPDGKVRLGMRDPDIFGIDITSPVSDGPFPSGRRFVSSTRRPNEHSICGSRAKEPGGASSSSKT